MPETAPHRQLTEGKLEEGGTICRAPSRFLALPPPSATWRIRLGRTFHARLAGRRDPLEHALGLVTGLLNLFLRSLLGALLPAGTIDRKSVV